MIDKIRRIDYRVIGIKNWIQRRIATTTIVSEWIFKFSLCFVNDWWVWLVELRFKPNTYIMYPDEKTKKQNISVF